MLTRSELFIAYQAVKTLEAAHIRTGSHDAPHIAGPLAVLKNLITGVIGQLERHPEQSEYAEFNRATTQAEALPRWLNSIGIAICSTCEGFTPVTCAKHCRCYTKATRCDGWCVSDTLPFWNDIKRDAVKALDRVFATLPDDKKADNADLLRRARQNVDPPHRGTVLGFPLP